MIVRLYGGYAVTVFAVVALLVLIIVAVMPGLRRRRQVARCGARAIFRLCGISIDYGELATLPTEPCVVVANHASYIDGVLLCALLPPRFGFVIKREVTRAPLVHLLLRRIGAYFVERHNRQAAASDTRSLLRAAGAGQSLAVFPEGTFQADAGLLRFRAGAFAAAVAGRRPVVPVTIQGARDILPAGVWLPRPGQLRVRVFPQIACEGEGRTEMQRLARASRAVFLRHLDEPDLTAST
ncbi:MAG: lysophospholipid acyltransferase family protein [Gammaproteobacteria bacterium]